MVRRGSGWCRLCLVHAAADAYEPLATLPGAVDVTLIDHQCRGLDMDTRVNASTEESEGACYTDAPNLSARAGTRRSRSAPGSKAMLSPGSLGSVMFTIGDFAKHGRVSVRMLRHYDTLGPLRPARRPLHRLLLLRGRPGRG